MASHRLYIWSLICISLFCSFQVSHGANYPSPYQEQSTSYTFSNPILQSVQSTTSTGFFILGGLNEWYQKPYSVFRVNYLDIRSQSGDSKATIYLNYATYGSGIVPSISLVATLDDKYLLYRSFGVDYSSMSGFTQICAYDMIANVSRGCTPLVSGEYKLTSMNGVPVAFYPGVYAYSFSTQSNSWVVAPYIPNQTTYNALTNNTKMKITSGNNGEESWLLVLEGTTLYGYESELDGTLTKETLLTDVSNNVFYLYKDFSGGNKIGSALSSSGVFETILQKTGQNTIYNDFVTKYFDSQNDKIYGFSGGIFQIYDFLLQGNTMYFTKTSTGSLYKFSAPDSSYFQPGFNFDIGTGSNTGEIIPSIFSICNFQDFSGGTVCSNFSANTSGNVDFRFTHSSGLKKYISRFYNPDNATNGIFQDWSFGNPPHTLTGSWNVQYSFEGLESGTTHNYTVTNSHIENIDTFSDVVDSAPEFAKVGDYVDYFDGFGSCPEQIAQQEKDLEYNIFGFSTTSIPGIGQFTCLLGAIQYGMRYNFENSYYSMPQMTLGRGELGEKGTVDFSKFYFGDVLIFIAIISMSWRLFFKQKS